MRPQNVRSLLREGFLLEAVALLLKQPQEPDNKHMIPQIVEVLCQQLALGSETANRARFLLREQNLWAEWVMNNPAFIPSGSFTMGSPVDEPGREGDEQQHTVQIYSPFLCDRVPVTQRLYEYVSETYFGGDLGNRPLTGLSWDSAAQFCNERSKMDNLQPCYEITYAPTPDNPFKIKDSVTWYTNHNGWRLPTEAEWEYACRAGTTGARYHEPLEEIAWFRDNTEGPVNILGRHRRTVARLRPNSFGLFDTLGNIRELCFDRTALSYRHAPDQRDVRLVPGLRLYGGARYYEEYETEGKLFRVVKGGCITDEATNIRAAARNETHLYNSSSVLGFRCVRTMAP